MQVLASVFKESQLPCKFLSYNPVTLDNGIELQKKLEADAVRDGLLRYARSYEYHLATDSKPVRDLLAHCLNPPVDVIRAEPLKLKTSQGLKLEKYVIPLASVHPEPVALITLGIMFNAISRSEFNEGKGRSMTAPGTEHIVNGDADFTVTGH